MATNGLVLIKPTSTAVTGGSASATINAGGSVTFTTCETLSLNGVFSSAYDNYIISVRYSGSTTATLTARVRDSGTDATGANYTSQYLDASSTTVSAARSSSRTNAYAGAVYNTQRCGDTIYIYGPYLAQPTAIRTVNVNDLTSAGLFDAASTHSLSTAYDGITFSPTGGNITGLIKVYGLVK